MSGYVNHLTLSMFVMYGKKRCGLVETAAFAGKLCARQVLWRLAPGLLEKSVGESVEHVVDIVFQFVVNGIDRFLHRHICPVLGGIHAFLAP